MNHDILRPRLIVPALLLMAGCAGFIASAGCDTISPEALQAAAQAQQQQAAQGAAESVAGDVTRTTAAGFEAMQAATPGSSSGTPTTPGPVIPTGPTLPPPGPVIPTGPMLPPPGP